MRLNKRLRWIVGGAVLVSVITALAVSGWPQQWAVRWAIVTGLDATSVEVKDISLRGHPHVGFLRVRGIASLSQNSEIEARNVDIDYRISLRRRRIESLSMDSLHVFIDTTGVDKSPKAVDRKQPAETADSSYGPWFRSRWVPRKLQIEQLGGELTTPGLNLSLNGISLQAQSGWFSPSISVFGDNISGSWRVGPDGPTHTIQGSAHVDLVSDEFGVMIRPMSLEFGDVLTAHGVLQMGGERGRPDLSIRLNDAHAGALDLEELSLGSVPIAFDAIDISNLRLDGSWATGTIAFERSTVQAHAKNLRIGRRSTPYYEGALSIATDETSRSGRQCKLVVTLNQGQSISLSLKDESGEIQSRASFADWSREQWMALLPCSIRNYANSVPSAGKLSGSADISYILGAAYAKGTITSLIAAPDGEMKLPVEFEVTIPPFWSPDVTHVRTSATLPASGSDATVKIEYSRASEPADEGVDIQVANVSPQKEMKALGMPAYLPDYDGTISGRLSLRRAQGDAQVDVDLRVAPFSCGFFTLGTDDALTVKGHADSDNMLSVSAIQNVDVGLGGLGSLKVREGTLDRGAQRFSGKVAAQIDLERLGAYAELKGVRGRADVTFPLEYKNQVLHAKFAGSVSDFAFGPGAASLSQPVSIKGTLVADTAGGDASLTDVEVRATAGTVVTSKGRIAISGSGDAQVPFSIQSDLTLLTQWGWLATARGTLTASGALLRNDGAYNGDCDFDGQAESMALPNGLAALAGVSFKGHMRHEGALSGSGDARVTSILIAGTTVRDLAGTVEFVNDGVKIGDLAASIFGGRVKAELYAGVLSSELPVSIKGALDTIDLEAFTREFNPPGAKLTGSVQGEFALEMERGALKDFRVKLKSDKAFSMNRDLVQQLLVSGAVKGFTGAKSIERVMNDIVGQADQRAFDTAEIALEFRDGALKGKAALRSKELNLTIDLTVDPDALKSALELRQQTLIENVANIRANPVQL